MIVALVTARGGSKRVPYKNIRPLAGRPLIEWTIKPALNAQTIDRIIVSTDDDRIAQISTDCGAEVPFTRPAELSGDHASHYGVIEHALNWLENENGLPDALLLLQPTSPFRSAALLDDIVATWREDSCDCLTSVCPVEDHPAFMFRKDHRGALSPYQTVQKSYQRSQDQEALFVLNGAAYILDPVQFRSRDKVLSDNPRAYVMDRIQSLDIDTEEDFLIAEAMVSSGLVANS